MLESASLLDLSLLCTYGTPVADMLAHSPPLPLILDYHDLYDYVTADDELGIITALEHRDRVRRIRIMQPIHILHRLIKALHGEFPNLEYIFIERHTFFMPGVGSSLTLVISETFRASRLRYLMVMGFHLPIGSSFMTMGNLVTLSLNFDVPWAYFHPNPLLQQLSPMPQLESSRDTFNTCFPGDDNQLLRRAVMRRVAPYLHRFGFQGANSYLEALLPRVTIGLVERLQLYFLDQLKIYLILPRRQFKSSSETVLLKIIKLTFLNDHLRVDAYSHDTEFRTYRFGMTQSGRHLNWQLASITKFFGTLRTVFSPVECLILRYEGHSIPSGWNSEADPTEWREFLKTFNNLKALYMSYEFVRQLSRSLGPDEGESPTDLLPELQDLGYFTIDDSRDNTLFVEFVHARRNAGRPVSVYEVVIPR